MLRKKKSFNFKGAPDGRYVNALRDRTIEEEKLNEYKKKHELVSRHLREEELKWQKSEVRAFDKKHLGFNEEKLEEIEPYETLDFDTLADVIALGSAQLNLQKVLALQSKLLGLYDDELEILDNCYQLASEEKEYLTSSFMSSITDSPFLLNTKRNFDNKIRHDQLKQELAEVVITVAELKEKISEHSMILKTERSIVEEERKILFNTEVITDEAALARLKPLYQQVTVEDTNLNEQLVLYNKYEKLRMQKERMIEEKSAERIALEYRAIYGGVTGPTNTSSTAAGSSSNNIPLGSSSGHTATTTSTVGSGGSQGIPPAPIASPAVTTSHSAFNPYGTDPTDYEHLTEAIALYEKECANYSELIKYYEIQEKALAEAVKHAKAEIKFLREGRVLKSYAYYDEIAKQWSETNQQIEKLRKNIATLVQGINQQDKKLSQESQNMLKSFKAVTEGLPNKRAVYRFLRSESYQTLLQLVKQPIQQAKEFHQQRNQASEQYQTNKQAKETLLEELFQQRDGVLESFDVATKSYHKYSKSLESYDVTIHDLDHGKVHGMEQLSNAKRLLSLLTEEQQQLQKIQSLQKQEEECTRLALQKIEILEDRIDVEKHAATYHTAFAGIVLGGGNGLVEELAALRTMRDPNQVNSRTSRIQQIVDARARLAHRTGLKFLCKQGKTYFTAANDVSNSGLADGDRSGTDCQYMEIEIEKKCITKSKVVYTLEETITVSSQVHLEKARKVLPYSHSSAYALVFLPYRGKISQSISAPIEVSAAGGPVQSIPIPTERVVRRKSTSIEPGIVSKMKRTHSALLRKGSVRSMMEDDDHSESGITLGSNNSTLGNMLQSHSNNSSDYSKEIQSIELTLQKLFKYEQELISDNTRVMADVSNLLQTPAGKRLLESREEKWLQKIFFPETEFEEIISKFELLSTLPSYKKAFYVDYDREKGSKGGEKQENADPVEK